MKLLNMERRQKYFEDVLKRQQRQLFKVSKELELHREFLNLQFESFMEFLFQNGGQIIQLSGKNGQDDETGVFLPIKKDRSKDAAGTKNGEETERRSTEENGDAEEEDGEEKDSPQHTTQDEEEEEGEGEGDDLLPPPQAILGSPSADCSSEEPESGVMNLQKRSGSRYDHEQDRGYSSRRSSAQNVVSSSDAQNGDADGDYDDEAEVDSSAEYENGLNGNPEMMKYDMNHFSMFSHFLDGGAGDENGMDGSYNDNDNDDDIYDGEDDSDINIKFAQPTGRSMPMGRQAMSWSNNGSSRNGTSSNNFHQGKAPEKLPIPASNIPHNERTCRYCGKTFHWKQSWVIHERTHTGEKPYLCKCGKAFSQKSNMNTHAKSCAQAMTTQKGKTTVFQMKCSHCQKMFTHKKNLDLHMEKFHPEVLNLSVRPPSSSSSPSSSVYQNGAAMMEADMNAAAARAAENAAILQILKNATAAAQLTSSSSSNGNSSSKPSLGPRPISPLNHNSNSNGSMSGGDDRTGRYPCPYCPKRFPVKGTLERHLRVHTGEKPFLCGLCGKAFTQKGSVKLHLERVHRQTM